MKAKEIIATMLEHGISNDKCGIVNFEDKNDVEILFGRVSCYSSLRFGVDYLYYWPGGREENLFPYDDALICVEQGNKKIDYIYLIKIE